MIAAGGRQLEYRRIDASRADAATLVFLHEGLGSVSAWRDFPDALASATECAALVYSRWGHGASETLAASRGARFMHDEALVVLPELLDALGIGDPILIGHSDGASIALIHAGACVRPVRALILEAPHVFVEDISIESISRMRELYETGDLRDRLRRHHGDNADGAFRGWNNVWLDPAFRDWNIEEYLSGITCPTLLIQGEDDEYGTLRQVEAIVAAVRGPTETLVLPRCGHAPHRDQREKVLKAMSAFVSGLVPEEQ